MTKVGIFTIPKTSVTKIPEFVIESDFGTFDPGKLTIMESIACQHVSSFSNSISSPNP